jgi:hypothetical protein
LYLFIFIFVSVYVSDLRLKIQKHLFVPTWLAHILEIHGNSMAPMAPGSAILHRRRSGKFITGLASPKKNGGEKQKTCWTYLEIRMLSYGLGYLAMVFENFDIYIYICIYTYYIL